MNDIVIVRHIAHEGPGYLASFLDRHNVSYRIFAIDAGDPMPDTLNGIGGLVFMGGPMSVNDDLPWIEPALNLIRCAFDSGIPVLGHCLGGQLMAKALGATITSNAVAEYGWLPVQVADNDTGRNWFGSTAREFMAFHWHGETFTLPESATHVLESEHCHNQAFVIGNSLAMQCHIEMTPELVQEWIGRASDETLTPAPSIQSADDILEQLDNKIATLQSHADTVYLRWIEGLR